MQLELKKNNAEKNNVGSKYMGNEILRYRTAVSGESAWQLECCKGLNQPCQKNGKEGK